MALSKINLDKAGVTGTLPTANLDTVGVAQGGTGITSGTTDQFLKFTGTTTLASAVSPSFSVSDITGATALTAEPASTDQIVLSDAGTLKKMDFAHIMARPAFMANDAGSQTISTGTMTLGVFGTETFDTDSKYGSNTFTPALAGYYWCFANAFFASVNDGTTCTCTIKRNGLNAEPWSWGASQVVGGGAEASIRTSALIYLDANDYIQVGLYQNNGGNITTVVGRSYFGAYRIVGNLV